MKNQFNIKEALTAIRENIIAKYNELTSDKFFDGVSLKQFMIEILNIANRNSDRMRSQNSFDKMIMNLVANVMMNHKRIGGNDLDAADKKKMQRYYAEDWQQRIK